MRQIFIYRDGQDDQGPYTLEQVQARLIVGALSATDLAWYEGLPDKMPLSLAITQLEQQGEHASDDWQRKVATADQKAELHLLGLKVKRDLTQGGCQDLIDEACKDQATKLRLEVFRLKRTKERDFLDFLRKNNFKLGMMVPTMAQLRETLDFLQDSIPSWATETSPEEFAKLILIRYPDLKNNWESAAAEVKGVSDWGDDPATGPQLAYLSALGAPFSPDIKKAEASELIDRYKNQATDAQKRRLTFYGLDSDPDITKEQASRLIDSYCERHPESEDAYQEWKIRNGIPKSASLTPLRPAKPLARWQKISAASFFVIIGMVVWRVIFLSQIRTPSTAQSQATYGAQPSPMYEAEPAPAPTPENFIEERQTLYARVMKTAFAETGSGSIHLRPGDMVLVIARNSKYARIDLNGKMATIPLSVTDLAETSPTR